MKKFFTILLIVLNAPLHAMLKYQQLLVPDNDWALAHGDAHNKNWHDWQNFLATIKPSDIPEKSLPLPTSKQKLIPSNTSRVKPKTVKSLKDQALTVCARNWNHSAMKLFHARRVVLPNDLEEELLAKRRAILIQAALACPTKYQARNYHMCKHGSDTRLHRCHECFMETLPHSQYNKKRPSSAEEFMRTKHTHSWQDYKDGHLSLSNDYKTHTPL